MFAFLEGLKSMGVPKTEEFNRQQNELAAMARALASPSRVAILEFIYDRDNCTCSEIVDRLPLAQATISRHLKELKENGLIEGRASGTSVLYSINRKKWDLCRARFERFFRR
ncbi:ArsR/SmtB family transcription factor [Leptonema illini]|uniref:Transcriptional regulator, ArsR family n=2 Tax=Leptonema illini TaxID=183 RepID=H2CBT4_9LEPT|nr:metalloregulator ArsR/SmtB family transcription factor [Leptonema illini]EHQ08538.1 transcriptional regulator, ArsR family [Leptonema illini DSM 21528]